MVSESCKRSKRSGGVSEHLAERGSRQGDLLTYGPSSTASTAEAGE